MKHDAKEEDEIEFGKCERIRIAPDERTKIQNCSIRESKERDEQP